MRNTDNVAMYSTPAEFDALLRKESRSTGEIIQKAHISL